MRIVCDSCGAKYSIADEKVAGKTFKIRCKKCSAVIVVKGNASASQPAASLPSEPAMNPNEGIWHVVVNGDQQGPFTPAQIGEMLSDSSIDWEAYVWRDGFDNWLPAREVQELVDAIMGPSDEGRASQAPDVSGGDVAGSGPMEAPDTGLTQISAIPAAAAAELAAPNEMVAASAGELFGSEPSSPSIVANRTSLEQSADLFATNAGTPFDEGANDEEEDVVASMPSPRVSTEQAQMTGARNENSVLFSLQSLQALATGPAQGAGVASSSPKPGHAGADGSGLIDIKALASAAASTSGAPSAKDRVDDLLSIGTGTSALHAPLGAPVLGAPKESSGKGLLFGIIGAAAVVLLAGAGVLGWVMTQKNDNELADASNEVATVGAAPAPSAEPAAQAMPTPTTPTMPEGSAPSPTSVEGQEVAAAVATAAGSEAQAALEANARVATRERGNEPSRQTSVPAAQEPARNEAPRETPRTEEPARPSNTNARTGDIDDLLNRALGETKRTPTTRSEPAAAADSNLPDTPPRDAVLAALRSVQGPVEACGGGQHGVANAAVTVAGSTGRVSNVAVSGQFAGTPIGSCVARAVRGARFPRFRRDTFSVSFPYRL